MEYQRKKQVTFLRLEKGEELLEALSSLCKKENIQAGTVCGIGATDEVTVGLFDAEKKPFVSIPTRVLRKLLQLRGIFPAKTGNPICICILT